jgi:hypothetical protein
MVGGALYAGVSGAGPVAVAAALAISGVILVGGLGLRDARRRTIETVGTLVGFAILLWPIGVALAIGGAGT